MNSVLLSLLVFSIFLSVCLAKAELRFGLCNCYRQWKIVDCSNRHLTDTVIEGFAAGARVPDFDWERQRLCMPENQKK